MQWPNITEDYLLTKEESSGALNSQQNPCMASSKLHPHCYDDLYPQRRNNFAKVLELSNHLLNIIFNGFIGIHRCESASISIFSSAPLPSPATPLSLQAFTYFVDLRAKQSSIWSVKSTSLKMHHSAVKWYRSHDLMTGRTIFGWCCLGHLLIYLEGPFTHHWWKKAWA